MSDALGNAAKAKVSQERFDDLIPKHEAACKNLDDAQTALEEAYRKAGLDI